MDEKMDLMQGLAASGDDLLALFFTILWKRNNGSGAAHHHELGGFVRIPDTVVLHHSRPIEWYFTSQKNGGRILKKSRRHLTTDTVLAALCSKRGRSVSGCAAQFITHSDVCLDGVTVTYWRADNLPGFVNSNTAAGILQRFIDPKPIRGQHCNSEIVVIWTPSIVFMERRYNENHLDAAGPTPDALHSRCTVAEGDRYVRTSAVLSNHTTALVENAVNEVVRHIAVVFSIRVSSMTLHLKVDSDDFVYLTRCSAIRCTDTLTGRSVTASFASKWQAAPAAAARSRRRGNNDPAAIDHGIFDDVPLSATRCSSTAVTPSPTKPDGPCVLCGKLEGGGHTSKGVPHCYVSRRHVLFPLAIAAFSSSPAALFVDPSDVWRPGDAVPSHVLALDKNITPDEYASVMHDPLWLNGPVTVCLRCTDALAAVTARVHVDRDGRIAKKPFDPRRRKATEERAPYPAKRASSLEALKSTAATAITTLPPISKTPSKVSY